MSVYHCPLCPLIFQFRTEAEWHLREEHRSRVDEEADLHAELAVAARPLDAARLDRLRASTASPSVTLLLGTAPAATMGVIDIARLRQLAERIRRRLAAEPERGTAAEVVEHRLAKAISTAETLPTDRGLAVLVNEVDIAILTLPFAPRDRDVVDRGFATRDLEHALRRFPRYRVLVLGPHHSVLEGHAAALAEPAVGRLSPGGPVTIALDGAYPDPDALLAERIDAVGPLPLIVVGDHRQLDRFRHRSRYAAEIVAEVPRSRFHKADIGDLVGRALADIHAGQQASAVAGLRQADRQSRLAWGLNAAWTAVVNRTADRLWVEHDYAVPGRLVPGVVGIETTTDPAEPGVTDDLVDALLARAAARGIPTHVLDRHALGRSEPVAVEIPLATPIPCARPPSMAAAVT